MQGCNNIVISVLLEPLCHKSDNIDKGATICKHNLLMACLQTCCKLFACVTGIKIIDIECVLLSYYRLNFVQCSNFFPMAIVHYSHILTNAYFVFRR